MLDPNDLAAKKATLEAVEAEIAAEAEQFEDSIAELRTQCERLRIEYMEALRAEMTRVGHPPGPDLGSVLAVIEQAQQPFMVRRLRTLAVRYLVGGREHGPESSP
jgi:hypothetical protein